MAPDNEKGRGAVLENDIQSYMTGGLGNTINGSEYFSNLPISQVYYCTAGQKTPLWLHYSNLGYAE
uniref:Uncharacterized protein n=1 Tax=Anguilla anguilla TaxID=7936 RepID=A0A0E9TMZ8_ANGAN